MRIAFVANLDADRELDDPERYRPSTRSAAASAARAAPLRAQIAALFGAPVDVLVPGRPVRRSAAAAAVCWSPTPRALALLVEAGAPVPDAPPLAVLHRVNHRAFAAALDPGLPGARFVRSLGELRDALARQPGAGARGHLLERAFGFAGRGRKVLAPSPALEGALRTWIEASFTEHGGGLQVEPLVDVDAEFALHGLLDRAGRVVLGEPCRQEVDARGAWIATARAGDALPPAERDALAGAAARVAAALHASGYFGPFGIDAYRWRDGAGALRFQALGELNARLTMGWFTGMGDRARQIV